MNPHERVRTRSIQRETRRRLPNTIYLAALTAVVFGVTPLAAQNGERSGGSALLIEAAGATAGSAITLGAALLVLDTDECNNEDLGCILSKVAAAVGASAIGAPAGDWIIGRRARTDPSLLGASIGSIAGVAAAFGVVHLLSEELDLSRDDAVLFVSYSVTHGFVTALGSRLTRLLRE